MPPIDLVPYLVPFIALLFPAAIIAASMRSDSKLKAQREEAALASMQRRGMEEMSNERGWA